MSDTPRTDAFDAWLFDHTPYEKYLAMKNKAEVYERELTAVISERDQWKAEAERWRNTQAALHDIDAYRRQHEHYEARIAELEAKIKRLEQD